MIYLLGALRLCWLAYQAPAPAQGPALPQCAAGRLRLYQSGRTHRPASPRETSVPHQCRRLHGQTQRGRLRAAQIRVPAGQRRAAGHRRPGCADARRPVGSRFLRLYLQRCPPRWLRLHRDRHPQFHLPHESLQLLLRTKALGEEVLAGFPQVYLWRLRIPFNEVENPRNYLSKLMRYARLLEATNSISQLDEFVAATLCLLGATRALRHLQRHQPRPGHPLAKWSDLIKKTGVSTKNLNSSRMRANSCTPPPRPRVPTASWTPPSSPPPGSSSPKSTRPSNATSAAG